MSELFYLSATEALDVFPRPAGSVQGAQTTHPTYRLDRDAWLTIILELEHYLDAHRDTAGSFEEALRCSDTSGVELYRLVKHTYELTEEMGNRLAAFRASLRGDPSP